VLFENTTGLTLEGGSIVFSMGDNYLGEASFETMKPKGETLLPYAVALNTEVNIDQNVSKLPVKRTAVKDGEIIFYNDRKQRTIYTFNHLSKAKANVFMDHAFLEGWELVETTEPIDINDRYYRFNFNLPEKEKEKEVKIIFNVTEKTQDSESKTLVSCTAEDTNKWLEKGVISKDIHASILKIKQMQAESAAINKAIYAQEQEIRDTKDNQERYRKNINVVTGKEQLSFLKELRDEEDKLKKLYTDIKANKDKRTDIDARVQSNCASLTYSWEKKEEPTK